MDEAPVVQEVYDILLAIQNVPTLVHELSHDKHNEAIVKSVLIKFWEKLVLVGTWHETVKLPFIQVEM